MRQQIPISVEEVDRFIVTSWRTAYIIQQMYANLRHQDGFKTWPLVYLIQDYEAGFYPWSSEFVLAMSTYQWDGDVIRLFNSEELRQYIQHRHGGGGMSYVMSPVLNNVLREEIAKSEHVGLRKKKRLVVYGRPSIPRNAFELCVAALRLWAREYPDSNSWEVVSVGESHADQALGNGLTLKSLGQLSLENYAQLLLESSVGLSLMISPHPSYPPLEMALCGMTVITNSFETKSWSRSGERISVLDVLTPDRIAASLADACFNNQRNAVASVDWSFMNTATDFNGLFGKLKRDLCL
jgi:hypothetical protein